MKASSITNTGQARTHAQRTRCMNMHPLQHNSCPGTHCSEEDAGEGAPGFVPGRSGTAAPSGHCGSAQAGDLPVPKFTWDTALIIQPLAVDSTPKDGGGRCQHSNESHSAKFRGQVEPQFVVQNIVMVWLCGQTQEAQSDFLHFKFHTTSEVATDTLSPLQPKTANICINCNTLLKTASVAVFCLLGTFWTAYGKHYFCQTLMQFMKFPSLLIAVPYITKTGYNSWPDTKSSPLQGSQFPVLTHYIITQYTGCSKKSCN